MAYGPVVREEELFPLVGEVEERDGDSRFSTPLRRQYSIEGFDAVSITFRDGETPVLEVSGGDSDPPGGRWLDCFDATSVLTLLEVGSERASMPPLYSLCSRSAVRGLRRRFDAASLLTPQVDAAAAARRR